MAIRLYPVTKSVQVLEQLAGVPAGTMETLKVLRPLLNRLPDAHGADEDQDKQGGMIGFNVMRRFYPEVAKLEAFLTFGWGRMDNSIDLGGEYVGRVTDEENVRTMLFCQGVELPEGMDWRALEGLCWG